MDKHDLTKHKLDVFRLLQIVPETVSVELEGLCKESALKYLDRIADEPIDLGQIGLEFTKADAMARLQEIYGI